MLQVESFVDRLARRMSGRVAGRQNRRRSESFLIRKWRSSGVSTIIFEVAKNGPGPAYKLTFIRACAANLAGAFSRLVKFA